MNSSSRTTTLALALSIALGCSPKSSIDIGHDTTDASDAGGPGSSDIEAGIQSIGSPISCPYGWVVGTGSPLDVCCEKSSVSVSGQCAVIARGDRPYTCNATPDGCGCAFGAADHRYELRCNESSGCICLVDGLPEQYVRNDAGGTPRLDPYICGGGAAAMDDAWHTTCGFPRAGIDPLPSGHCPFGYEESGPSCCSADHKTCFASGSDQPFSCIPAGGKGCGCTMNQAPHAYALKCDDNTCVCAVNGYVSHEVPSQGLCASGDHAKTIDIWNSTCGFPPQTP